jgi:hypothetical protein
MLGLKSRRLAAVLLWLQWLPLFYSFAWDRMNCVGASCRAWSSVDLSSGWPIVNALIYCVPTILGILLWRGSRLAAMLSLVVCTIITGVCAFVALIFYIGWGWGQPYPLWGIPLSPLVLPGELALVTMITILVAMLWSTPNTPTAIEATGS